MGGIYGEKITTTIQRTNNKEKNEVLRNSAKKSEFLQDMIGGDYIDTLNDNSDTQLNF